LESRWPRGVGSRGEAERRGAASRLVIVSSSKITYYHVELTGHDVILAQGLLCESYLATGNRGAFIMNGESRCTPRLSSMRRVCRGWRSNGAARAGTWFASGLPRAIEVGECGFASAVRYLPELPFGE
jgi:hypothetical protein